MRIAIEGQRLFRKKKHGMDIVALELIKQLQNIDRQNEYYIFVKPGKDRCLVNKHNFHIIELNTKSYPIWEQIALPRAVKKYKCELLHCTSNTAPFFCPIPLVVTLHDIIYLENKGLLGTGGSLYQKFGNLYRRLNVPGAVKNAESIITVSNFEKSNIDKKMPQIKDKTIAIYNGVGEHFSPIRESKTLSLVREKYKLPEKYIFFLGNLAPKKNTPNVLKAYKRYHNSVSNPLPLVMIDFGKEKLRQMLASFQMENLLEHIHLSGYISNTDLPAIYSMSELFLYPSLRESFGIPILEAMRCGTPVITSTTSSMPEIAGDAALLVNPNNSKELANAIEYILSDQEFREKLIQKGFNRAKKFSWTKMAERNLKLYNKIYNELQKNKQ